jgi:hypothetical protein
VEEDSLAPEQKPSDEAIQDADPAEVSQDTFRKVYFGQASDPLYPRHPGPQESPDEELERAALEDPAAEQLRAHEPSKPTLWRLIVLFLVAIGALSLVFLWRM